MDKQLLTIENLLSWQEVLNFSAENYHFNYQILEKCYLMKSQINSMLSAIESYLDQEFKNRFSDFPFRQAYFNYQFIVRTNENGVKNVFIDMNSLFQQIVRQTTDQQINDEYSFFRSG